MTILAIETSCDETSAAIVRDGKFLSSVVSSQLKLHAEYGGVVPELAAREHLRNLIPVAHSALREAGISIGQLYAIAATQGPGLPNALLVGFKAAQAVAFALGKPFVGINHHEAHLYSPWISGEPPVADFSKFQPNVSLIVSGGHTMLVLVKSELNHRVLGSTLDDAAGECFDKTGKMMGLNYPAGPEIDRLAEQGNLRGALIFPRPMLNDKNDDFSGFSSGLKTSVRLFHPRDHPEVFAGSPGCLRDLCAQCAGGDCGRARDARDVPSAPPSGYGVRCITVSGGVTCNQRALQKRIQARACELAKVMNCVSRKNPSAPTTRR